MKDKAVCEHCNKSFATRSSKTRHLNNVHRIFPEANKCNRIFCPLCKDDNALRSFEKLYEHLLETHQIHIEKQYLKFSSKEKYEKWSIDEKIEVNYAIARSTNTASSTNIYYVCNRSNLRSIK